jgi:hypothetical protein
VKLDNVTREEQIVGGLALLLAIALIALPWFSVGGGSVGGISIPSIDLSATDAPDGWAGVLAFIVALAVLADLAVSKLSPQTQLPMIGGSRAGTRFVLAAVAAGFVALKFLLQIHFSEFGWGFYITIIITGALVYFAMQARDGKVSFPKMPRSGTTPRGGSTPPPA